MNRLLRLLSAALLLGGCVHPIRVAAREDARPTQVQIQAWPLDRLLPAQTLGPLQVRTFVYRPRELPLGEFFRRVARGDFASAVAAVKPSRPPAELDSKALRLLLEEGFVPVLVDVVNDGPGPIGLSRLHFRLAVGDERLEPIPGEDVPTVLSRLNSKALAANAYNAGALIIDVAEVVALVAAIVVLSAHGGGGGGFSGGGSSPRAKPGDEDRFVNPATKKVDVDPFDVLWLPRVLPPGGDARGLLFFRRERTGAAEARLETALEPAAAP